jgi:sphinganine C4-monooxygenase
LNKYRIHESEEVTRLNIATVSEVVRAVIIEQCRSDIEDPSLADHTQAMTQLASSLRKAMGFAFSEQASAFVLSSFGPQVVWWTYWYMIPAIQMFVALSVLHSHRVTCLLN